MSIQRARAMLGLWAETRIHAGAGSSEGVVDLPIQREAHTDWPCVFGSTAKGALKDDAKQKSQGADWLDSVFGLDSEGRPGVGWKSDYGGALGVGEAGLLLLPVRSLTTPFKWVTCPGLLRRFSRHCARLQLYSCELKNIPTVPDRETVIVPTKQEDFLFLEEFRLKVAAKDLGAILNVMARLMVSNVEFQAAQKKELENQIAVVHDAMFQTLCGTAIPIDPRIKTNDKKTTDNLWYEESLPPDTLMYLWLDADPSRDPQQPLSESQVLENVTALYKDGGYVRMGGNETVGMGWFKVSVVQEPT